MAIYLGSAGMVELQRTAETSFQSTIDPGDVNASEKRFSFDFHNGTFATGDRLLIARLNADGTPSTQPLDFVSATAWPDGKQHSDGAWFVHVDALGGLRLYDTWSAALVGDIRLAKTVQAPSSSYLISATLTNTTPRCLAQVLGYSINTERSAIDVTALGDAFTQQTSGLISAEGEARCLWDWYPSLCGESDIEQAQYVHQLILRQQIGSEFRGRFVLKRRGAMPLDDNSTGNEEIYYEGNCLVTNVGMAFSPGEPVESTIQFVVSGPLSLKIDTGSSNNLLLEDGGYIDLENGDRVAE